MQPHPGVHHSSDSSAETVIPYAIQEFSITSSSPMPLGELPTASLTAMPADTTPPLILTNEDRQADPRWRTLFDQNTPAQTPLSGGVLVPEPSPTRSTISDLENESCPPTPTTASFIHLRRRAMYVQRPPVLILRPKNDSPLKASNALPIPEVAGGLTIDIRALNYQNQMVEMASTIMRDPLNLGLASVR
jgi:hypothetical protein